jgi:septum formation protein
MLVLASSSPRRRDLLAQAGYDFRVLSTEICEDLRPGEPPIPYVLRLARAKAEAVAASPEFQSLAGTLAAAEPDPPLILGADTTVVAPSGEILLKPEDDADAGRMLRLLSGATHQVITGVALIGGDATEVAAEVTHVTVCGLTDDDIAAYIASGEQRGKAGAYGIQGRFGRFVPRIHGCYFNVVGLPLALVAGMIDSARNRRPAAAITASILESGEL